MIDISMEMEQYDCPYIDTSADHDVSFTAFHWEFDETARELDTRMVVDAADRDHLDAGIRALREHANLEGYELLRRWDDIAHIHTTIGETDAMEAIRRNGGYITGPFFIEGGSELWHVGFDSGECADRTLSDLERGNEFEVNSREQSDLPDLGGLVENSKPAMGLVDVCRNLTDVERQTLTAAVEGGYYDSPRQATLGTLADTFDVSKPTVSKNLRRAEGKILERAVRVLDDSDSQMG